MERIDDLQIRGLKLIQDTEQFCFGTDAVLLSHFASVMKGKQPKVAVDLCCGNGIIPVLLTAKIPGIDKITGIEVMEQAAALAVRNVVLNNLCSIVNIIHDNLINANQYISSNSVDLVTCNPPYKEYNGGIVNKNNAHTVARFEVMCTLSDIIEVSARILAPLGKLCMIQRPERLVDVVCLMRQYNLEPKRMRFVHPTVGKTANMVLIEAAKQGKPKLFLDPPLYLTDIDGKRSQELEDIYNKT